MSSSTSVRAVSVSIDPQEYEDEHVHAVYEEIASHFSSTRYKPWPIIAQFLSSLPAGWIGLDSGTGNGKYLPLDRASELWMVGMDRSSNLLRIAQSAGGKTREVILGDVLNVPWRPGTFDYAISIATIHHLSTHQRRRLAVKSLLQSISPDHGRALIYVWATEQDSKSKRLIPSEQYQVQVAGTDTRGVDVFVPWVLSDRSDKPGTSGRRASKREPSSPAIVENTRESNTKVFNRFYHMFAEGELERLVTEAAQGIGLQMQSRDAENSAVGMDGVEMLQRGWERSNYYVELRRWRK